MASQTANEVLTLALAAGFSRPEADTMVVIAYYESAWDPKNHGDTGLAQGSFGLWQIYSGAWSLHELGIKKYTDLYDPMVNARAARHVFTAQGFTAWSTYNQRAQHSGWDHLQSKVAALTPGSVPGVPAPGGAKPSPVLQRCADESRNPTHDWTNLCLKFVRTMYGIPAKYPTAIAAWNGAGGAAGKDTHTVRKAPAGVPVFWGGGQGHVAISDGQGNVWSSDIRRKGKVDLVPESEISRRWGKKRLGWSETLNGVRVYP